MHDLTDAFVAVQPEQGVKHMTVRDEVNMELARLSARVPIPVKMSLAEPVAKINILM